MTKRQPSHNASTNRKLAQAQSGTARAALLGVSDGLVTNVSLILGVAASGAGSNIVRIAGIASLIAGAFSMAVGEYVSMRGQIELLSGILELERDELRNNPQHARAELRQIMIGDGMSQATATTASNEIARSPEKAMALYARGKLGINPDELGSAWGSAISSFVMFSLGAFVPLVPWFFGDGTSVVIISLTLSGVAALGIGTYLGMTTGRAWWFTALRQLGILILAAGATFLVGYLFHTPAV